MPGTRQACVSVYLAAKLFSFGHLAWSQLLASKLASMQNREKQSKADFESAALGMFVTLSRLSLN